jgi:riboflavin kinase / FMN adenylyltransferase
MEIIHFKDIGKFREGIVTGIGKFDGVHLGHQKIIKIILDEAKIRDCIPAVFTFRKFPAEFTLYGWNEKLSLLRISGIKLCLWCDLDEISHISHKRFLDILVSSGVKTLVVGYDFHFGKGRRGNIKFLQSVKEDKGFELVTVPPQKVNGEVVNASKIRRFIKNGEVFRANSLLGRYFSITGKVVPGSNIGKGLGFPTANLVLRNKVHIGEGVYAGWVEYKGVIYKAAIVTGISPTFADRMSKFEVFIIGFEDMDIYGEIIKVFLFKRLREQIRFQDMKSLKTRIDEDVKEITALLNNQSRPVSFHPIL